MSKKKLIIGTLILLALVSIIIPLMNKKSGTDEIEVQTARVEKQKIVQTVTATGRIQPVTQVNISADVSAKIMRLGVKDGDWVEKGDFLVELDGERYRAAVESGEANLRSVQANAKLAKENMIKAEKDYLRTKELFEKNLESQATLDAVAAAFQVEKARYQSVLDQVEQANAALKQIKDDYSKTVIYAPMAGTVSQLNKEVGEIALGSQFQEDVIMVISNLSGMEALVDVDENDIVSISIGDTAKIEVDALPDIVFSGVVTEIANSAKVSAEGTQDQKTDFEVKIAVEGVANDQASSQIAGGKTEVKLITNGANRQLRPGMTASGDIVTETRENAVAVPIQCVAVRTPEQLKKKETPQSNDGEAIADEGDTVQFKPDKDGFVQVVFVVSNGKVEARQVKTGVQSESHIEILEGIVEGEEVVIGNYRAISKDLQNGSAVVVKNEGGDDKNTAHKD
jgi:HlyD family secretion protein